LGATQIRVPHLGSVADSDTTPPKADIRDRDAVDGTGTCDRHIFSGTPKRLKWDSQCS